MSLLSSIFNKHGGDADAEGKEEEWEEREEREERRAEQLRTSGDFPKLTRDMTVVVTMAETGKFLLSGRLAQPSRVLIGIERAPGQLAFDTCPVGTKVFIRGYLGSTPVDMKGTVQLSNRILLRVENLEVVAHDELRSNFRLPLDIPVSLYYQDDRQLENPERCQLVNISTGGACVDSEYIHAEGEVLRLKVHIGDYTPMTFLGQVIRVEEPKPGVFRYGFLFAQLTEQETSMLTRVLFNIQTGAAGPHLRHGYGHW